MWIDFQCHLGPPTSACAECGLKDSVSLHMLLPVLGEASTSSFRQTSSYSPGRVQLHTPSSVSWRSHFPSFSSVCTGAGTLLFGRSQPLFMVLSRALLYLPGEAVINMGTGVWFCSFSFSQDLEDSHSS